MSNFVDKLIKSPINQTGRKHKLLPQILPFVPEFKTGLDVFAGSGDVAVNANLTHVNDNCQPLIEWLEVLNTTPVEDVLNELDNIILLAGLNKTNSKAYYKLRDYYNKGYDNKVNPYLFYVLQAHAFNNQIRFNSNGGFNSPFGKRNFNQTMRTNLINFSRSWYGRDLKFTSKDFYELNYDVGFAYFDPPYSCGVASYNYGWDKSTDAKLFVLLNQLTKIGVKWALSNVFENNGAVNEPLMAFSKKYRVVEIESSYKGSNYHRKNNGVTKEVLVLNY